MIHLPINALLGRARTSREFYMLCRTAAMHALSNCHYRSNSVRQRLAAVFILCILQGFVTGCGRSDGQPDKWTQPSDRQILIDEEKQLSPSGTEARLRASLEWLADDARKGRGPHSAELDLAAEYLSEEMASHGLNGVHKKTPEFQTFFPKTTWSFDDTTQLTIASKNKTKLPLHLNLDFVPLAGSPAIDFSGDLVFVGYGIQSKELGYDDFENVELRGRVAVILRHEPRLNVPTSPFNGEKLSRHGLIGAKVRLAAAHGASAVLLCSTQAHLNPSITKGAETADALIRSSSSPKAEYPIPVLHVKRNWVDQWLLQSNNSSLSTLESAIDQSLSPVSTPLPGVSVTGKTVIQTQGRQLKNVIAYLPGKGKLAHEYLILGAHYDHLGMGQFGSLAPWTIAIHNGADDNASGTAGLIELGHRLALKKAKHQRGILLIAFSGEELGLLGSEFYCQNPAVPLEATVAMLNLDMVGRLSTHGRVEIFGMETAHEFSEVVPPIAKSLNLAIELHPDGYGPSDHASFYQHGIPVMHFFTGLHQDYHRPSDDVDKIDLTGLANVCDLVESIAWKLATAPERPVLNETPSIWGDGLFGSDSINSQPQGLGLEVIPQTPGTGLKVTRIDSLYPELTTIQVGDLLLTANGVDLNAVKQWHELTQDRTQELVLTLQRGGIKLRVRIPALSPTLSP
jgi:hypothetical protein